MTRTFMHAKLHGARVTECDLDYVGSITIDRALMDAVGIAPHQRVQICNKAKKIVFDRSPLRSAWMAAAVHWTTYSSNDFGEA